MSNHYEFGTAKGGLYQLLPTEQAEGEWKFETEEDLAAPWALGLFNENGDGLVLQGSLDDIVEYIDLLHDRVHKIQIEGAY